MNVLGDQSVGRSTEAGGLGRYSVGHWALSKFKRKRNDERLSGRVPPSQGPAARKEPYKETGGCLSSWDQGNRQDRLRIVRRELHHTHHIWGPANGL